MTNNIDHTNPTDRIIAQGKALDAVESTNIVEVDDRMLKESLMPRDRTRFSRGFIAPTAAVVVLIVCVAEVQPAISAANSAVLTQSLTPTTSPTPTPCPAATPTLTLQQKVESLEDRLLRLEQRPKDFWDKLEAASGLVAGGVVALISLIAGLIVRARDRRIQEARDQRDHIVSVQGLKVSQAEIVQKFMPQLLSEDPRAVQVALSVISAVDGEFSTRLSAYFESDGVVPVLSGLLASNPDPGVVQDAKGLLIRQMGSALLDITIPAVEELARYGWLYDGALEKANLRKAKLRGVNLEGAYLRGATLTGADLQGANLNRADLQDANLRGANLIGATLFGADLSRADLSKADLRECDLREAALYEVDLTWANLQGAKVRVNQLDQAKSSTYATMPDGIIREELAAWEERQEWEAEQAAQAEREEVQAEWGNDTTERDE